MSTIGTLLRFARWIACVVVAGAACSGGGSDGDEGGRRWQCNGSTGACTCFAERGSPGVSGEACKYYDCCLLIESAPGASSSQCECGLIQASSCEAEAASRANTRVVPECPPPEEQPPAHCAAEGSNCRDSYLASQGLDGCCSGLLCKENVDGVPVCTPGTEEELAFLDECNRVARRDGAPLAASGPLSTSLGPIPIEEIGSEGGGDSVTFYMRNSSPCYVDIWAGQRDAEGRMTVNRVRLLGSGCGQRDERDPAVIGGVITAVTVSCQAGGREMGSLGRACYTGSYEIVLTGAAGDVTFDGTPVVIRGSICRPAFGF